MTDPKESSPPLHGSCINAACGGLLYSPVAYCPYCGTRQSATEPLAPAAEPAVAATALPTSGPVPERDQPAQPPSPAATAPQPPLAPAPPVQAATPAVPVAAAKAPIKSRASSRFLVTAAALGTIGYFGAHWLGDRSPDECKTSLAEAYRLEKSGEPRQAQAKLNLALNACSGEPLERAKVLQRSLQPVIRALEACDRAQRDAEAQIGGGRLRQAQKLLAAQPTKCASRPDIVALRQAIDQARKSATETNQLARNKANEGRIDEARALVDEAEQLDRDNPDLASVRKAIEMKSRELAARGTLPAPASPSPSPPAPVQKLPNEPTVAAPAPLPAPMPLPSERSPLVAQILPLASAGNWAKLDSLVQTLKSAIAVQPGDRRLSRAGNAEGLQLLRAGNAVGAALVFRRAWAADPSDVEVVNNLGYALMQAGQIKDALTTLEQVIAMAPDRTNAWANYAETLALSGNESGAAAALRIALRYSADRQRSVDAFLRVREAHPNTSYARVIYTVLGDMDSIPRGR